MPRVRLGVVALLPHPVAAHVQAWRRAFAEPLSRAVPPHVTLVPPQQVPADQVDRVAELVEGTARMLVPVRLSLRGAASFLPGSPVAFLRVTCGAGALAALEAGLRGPPLQRRTHAYHAHVTVAQDLPAERIRAAVAELAGFAADVTVEQVALMREDADGRWRPLHLAPSRGPGPDGAAVTAAPFADAQAASVFLLDGDRVLLGRRTERPGRRHPGAWDPLGGKPEPGEPLLAALAREAGEEAGVEPLDPAPLGCFFDGERADAYFVARSWRGRVANTAPAEHSRLEWLPLPLALDRPLPPSARHALLLLVAEAERAGPGR